MGQDDCCSEVKICKRHLNKGNMIISVGLHGGVNGERRK